MLIVRRHCNLIRYIVSKQHLIYATIEAVINVMRRLLLLYNASIITITIDIDRTQLIDAIINTLCNSMSLKMADGCQMSNITNHNLQSVTLTQIFNQISFVLFYYCISLKLREETLTSWSINH